MKFFFLNLRREIRNSVGGSALIGQNSVRCPNTFLSLDDENHTNCQHRLTFSKSANFESFQQPSNVIEFLIFYATVRVALYMLKLLINILHFEKFIQTNEKSVFYVCKIFA